MSCSCVHCWGGFVTMNLQPLVRLRTSDGGYVFLEFHEYFGPTFWRDRAGTREAVPDVNDLDMCPLFQAFDWWHARGKRG